jgi:hypothetical protein
VRRRRAERTSRGASGRIRHGSRDVLVTTALLAVATAAAGCEYFRDTPEQELAGRRWRQCAEGRRDVTLDRVDTDGRVRFTYGAMHERDRILECLDAAGRDGPRLPEPVPAAAAGK